MKGKIFEYLGSDDIEQVALYSVFPGSPIAVVSPVEVEDRWPVVIEGPEFQLRFLHDALLKMVKLSPFPGVRGSWVAVRQHSAERMDLFYQYGTSPEDRIELLEAKFRDDIVRYGDIRLAELSILEVICDGDRVLREPVALPEGFKNGTIDVPLLLVH